MTSKSTGIGLALVRPFFQVVVFVRSKHDPSPDLEVDMPLAMRESKRLRSKFKIITVERKGALQYSHLQHTAKPSWVRGLTKYRDVENDEALLYLSGRHIFVHSNCPQLLDILSGWYSGKYVQVPAGDIEKVLASRRPEIRSLGMQNLNAPGRTAPEGKTYFARNATNALSPARDAMFGLRHAFAVERDSSGRSKPFGCSTSKRKIWGTWVENAEGFVAECDRVVQDLARADPGKRPWPLAAPISKSIGAISPIAFYADYYIHGKGILWIEGDVDEFSSDWSCYLNDRGKATFDIVTTRSGTISLELDLAIAGAKVTMEYPPGSPSRKVKVADVNGELENRRAHDFVEFLNREETFTVIFEKGISYRSDTLWQSERLCDPFKKARLDISWAATDIRLESFAIGRKDTISDAIVELIKKEGWAEVILCDDGANEVADFLATGSGRIALIHAKFSSDALPGLRIGDLQTVAAQAVKNLHFFQWIELEKQLARLRTKVRPEIPLKRDLGDILRESSEDQRTSRECWIVQPGLSAAKLGADITNKAHALLNYVESTCYPGNIEFRLYCSP